MVGGKELDLPCYCRRWLACLRTDVNFQVLRFGRARLFWQDCGVHRHSARRGTNWNCCYHYFQSGNVCSGARHSLQQAVVPASSVSLYTCIKHSWLASTLISTETNSLRCDLPDQLPWPGRGFPAQPIFQNRDGKEEGGFLSVIDTRRSAGCRLL